VIPIYIVRWEYPQNVEMVTPTGERYVFDPYRPYVCTNVTAGRFLLDAPTVCCIQPMEKWHYRPPVVMEPREEEITDASGRKRVIVYDRPRVADLNGRTLLMLRPGGFGDALFATATCHVLKEKFPLCRIAFCTTRYVLPAVSNNPDIDETVVYPLPLNGEKSPDKRLLRPGWADYDYHVNYDCIIEHNPAAQHVHAIDLMARHVGLELTDEQRRIYYYPTEMERRIRDSRWRKPPGETWVGYHLSASTPVRTYPPRLARELIGGLLKKGWKVFLFGRPGERWFDQWYPDGLPDGLHPLVDGYNFRQSAAMLELMDVMIGQDSVFVHLAAALEVPCVGLYAAFPSRLRVCPHAPVTALDRHDVCQCHFLHSAGFPPDKPCAQEGGCVGLLSIHPDEIIAAAERWVSPAPARAGVAVSDNGAKGTTDADAKEVVEK
jgi:ADP-heptose:LPS heptosyltransferase